LDAVELMNYGVNLMREHVQPTARIHYVIPSAGEAPNVVPEYAQAWYYVRDLTRETVEEYYSWILDIAEGAAKATRTTHEVHLVTGVHETNLNRPMLEIVQRNLEIVGPPTFPDAFHTFARDMQDALEIEQNGLFTDIKELAEQPEPASGGSTDVAEVSHITPTAGLSVATAPQGIPWHSWATAAAHGTPGAVEGAMVAAKVLALTGIDLLTDADLRQRARAFFDEATNGQPYQSPIPADQEPPIPGR
jgi:aminobenzoyl-glutamate utilization protein B